MQSSSAAGVCCRSRHAVLPRCTTRRGNAHRTEEREVLYAFHPWTGCIVHIHEVIKKPSGDVVRCSRDGGATGRWFGTSHVDVRSRGMCCGSVETLPRVHITALSALMALIGQASGGGNSAHLVTSNALICGVARISTIRIGKIAMRRHSPHQNARSTARQFDLFAAASIDSAVEALPDWRTLPDQTRHTLIGLLTPNPRPRTR